MLRNQRVNKIIVHFALDEKFIDMALREFEAVAPGQNKLIILGKKRALQFVETNNLTFMSISQAKSLVHSKECGAVIFHSLPDLFFPILKDIPRDKKVIWLGWGYDYYDRLLSGAHAKGLLLPETKALVAHMPKQSPLRTLICRAKSIRKHVCGWSNPELERVDYFSPVIDIEHQMAVGLNPQLKADYVCWNYGTVEDDLSPGTDISEPLGENILVGNSATPENNHLEAFNVLERRVDLRERKVIVPLSYGSALYREKISAIGYNKFGNQFVPLVEFMPHDDYIALLQSCGHVLMNHLRQQALGNICIMMLKGAKIYMNPGSPLYRWLQNKGAVIQSIEAISGPDNLQRSFRPLTEREKKQNKKVIEGHWGREVQREKTRRLVNCALDAGEGRVDSRTPCQSLSASARLRR